MSSAHTEVARQIVDMLKEKDRPGSFLQLIIGWGRQTGAHLGVSPGPTSLQVSAPIRNGKQVWDVAFYNNVPNNNNNNPESSSTTNCYTSMVGVVERRAGQVMTLSHPQHVVHVIESHILQCFASNRNFQTCRLYLVQTNQIDIGYYNNTSNNTSDNDDYGDDDVVNYDSIKATKLTPDAYAMTFCVEKDHGDGVDDKTSSSKSSSSKSPTLHELTERNIRRIEKAVAMLGDATTI